MECFCPQERHRQENAGTSGSTIVREIADYPTMNFDYEESGDGFLVNVNYQEQKTVTTPKTTPKTRDRLLELIGAE
jgi:hypothetical protein